MSDIEEFEQPVKALVIQARSITGITDPNQYTAAGQLWDAAKALRAKIAEVHDANIKRWHEGHKAAVAEKKRDDGPLDEAQRYLKQLMIQYDLEEEKKRRLEQARLEAEAKKRAEEEALELAATMEAAGAHDAAAAVLDAPLDTPVVVAPPKQTPKVEGFKYRSIWNAEVTSLLQLVNAVADGSVPVDCLLPNQQLLDAQARALKTALRIPGVRAVERKV